MFLRTVDMSRYMVQSGSTWPCCALSVETKYCTVFAASSNIVAAPEASSHNLVLDGTSIASMHTCGLYKRTLVNRRLA